MRATRTIAAGVTVRPVIDASVIVSSSGVTEGRHGCGEPDARRRRAKSRSPRMRASSAETTPVRRQDASARVNRSPSTRVLAGVAK